MGLQIKVRHALGERVMELPDRTIDQPVVIGRSSSAEVQVPWATVASKHCVLFIHEGSWVVQDLGGGGGTYVNRKPVQGAQLLQIGDVIQMGREANAPTITVDPAAAAEGRTGYAGTGLPHMDTTAAGYGSYGNTGGPAAPGYAAPGYTAPGYAAPGYAAPSHAAGYGNAPAAHASYPTPPQYAGQETHATANDEISYTPSYTPSYSPTRRRKQGNGGMVAVMIIAVLLIGGVVGFVVYRNQGPKVIIQKQPDVVVVKTNPNKPKGLFEEGVGSADTALDKTGKPGKPATAPTGQRPPNAAVVDPRAKTPAAGEDDDDTSTNSTGRPPRPLNSGTVTPGSESKDPASEPGMDPVRKPGNSNAGEPGMDPVRKPAGGGADEPGMDPVRRPEPAKPTGPDAETLDPAMAKNWETMKQLAETPGKESFAILRFEDFRKLNPGKFDQDLDTFIDQKLDRIWWERIDQLFKKMDKLTSDIDRTQNEVFDENNPEIKKQKLAALKTMKTDLEDSTKLLRETMGYGEAGPPNLGSSAELSALAQKRDKLKYEGWKKATLFYIKNNQGRLQWMNET